MFTKFYFLSQTYAICSPQSEMLRRSSSQARVARVILAHAASFMTFHGYVMSIQDKVFSELRIHLPANSYLSSCKYIKPMLEGIFLSFISNQNQIFHYYCITPKHVTSWRLGIIAPGNTSLCPATRLLSKLSRCGGEPLVTLCPI